MRTQEIILTPGDEHKVITGFFFRILEASAPVDLQLYGYQGKQIGEPCEGVEAGFSIESTEEIIFTGITSAVGQTIKVLTSYQQKANVSTISGNVNAVIESSANVDDAADLALVADTNTVLCAADADRKEIVIQNLSSSLANIRIKKADTADIQGVLLEPGRDLILETSAALWVRAIGNTATVTRFYLKK